MVVMCKFREVDNAPNYPLAWRLCTHTAWTFDREGERELEAGQLSRVHLVVHVVPAFADFIERRGVKATPSSYIGQGRYLLEM